MSCFGWRSQSRLVALLAFFPLLSNRIQKPTVSHFRRTMSFGFLLATVMLAWSADGLAKTATTTSLTISTNAGPAETVASGTVVILTASVKPSSGSIQAGQVNFCDASAKYCTDIHLLGAAQLTHAGTATFKLRAGIGSHSYKAVFLGTAADSGSLSSATTLTVTGKIGLLASTTTIAETGSWGVYKLTATVTESGGTAPPTGSVSFLDTSNNNASLSKSTLGPSVAGIDWPNPLAITTDTDSGGVAVGDFNGDGIPDLATIAGGPEQPLLIFLGNENGTYTQAPYPPISGYSLRPIVVADLNGDGKQDLAILDGDNNTVVILLGNGDGTFTATASSPASGMSGKQMVAGDFNGDGIVDLAITVGGSTSMVNILLGKGDGTFVAAASNSTVTGAPGIMAVGDFNGDGKLDMAVADQYDDTITILPGNGNGTFGVATTMHSGSSGAPIAAGDFNEDGKLDLAVGVGGASGSADSVTILNGNGDGTFTGTGAASGSALNGSSVPAIEVGDFNGDGIPDLVLSNSYTGIITVFLGNGIGNGAASFNATTLSTPATPYYQLFLAVEDLNGDGVSDLAVGNGFSDSLLVYLTEHTETATASSALSLAGVGQHLVDAAYAGGSSYSSSVSGTIPLWGIPPATTTALSVTSEGAPATTVKPGVTVTLTATVKVGTNPLTLGMVNFCDASASSCTDIHLLKTVSLLSNGTATFKFFPGAGVHSYKAVFMEDGHGMSSSSATSTLTVGPPKSIVYTDAATLASAGGSGDYSLTATVTGYGATAQPTGIVSFLDTSFANKSLATASLGTSAAGLGWLTSLTPTVNYNLLSEASGDFNGDGIPDLALLGATNSSDGPYLITVFFGKGDGTFTTNGATIQPAGVQQYPTMIAQDVNGDGKPDLLILSWNGYSTSYVTSMLNGGNGTFAGSQTSVVFNQGPVGGDGIQGAMVAADFNGDGKIDLAVVGDDVGVGGVSIVLGNGAGGFKAMPANLAPSLGFGAIATGDFNGDGIPDLVAANYFSPGGASVFLGKGDGTFTTSATQLTVDTFANSIVAADFNGDGKLDLAFGFTSGLTVFLGKGDGTFNPPSTGGNAAASLDLTVGDFNHDGKLDMAAIDKYNDAIDIFLGAGDGTFTPMTILPNIGQDTSRPFQIVTADFNGDGVPDVSVLTQYEPTASILLTEPTQTATATVNGIAPIGAGTHNVDAKYSGDKNYGAAISSTVALTAGLEPIVVTPAAGAYSTAQTIKLSEAIPGATIYYSAYGIVNTNGFVPYTGPISVAEGGTETIQAYATEAGYQQSYNLFATFTINLPGAAKPVFSPAAGSYANQQTVMISDAAPNATIYYTTDGSMPTTASAVYKGSFVVASSETVVAMAIAPGYSLSAAGVAQYLIGSSSTSFVYTVAGNGAYGYSGNGGPATFADLNNPSDTALDSAGNLYIADNYNSVIRKVAASTGIITTVAGDGLQGYSGDGKLATAAKLSFPRGITIDSAGNLYISDDGNYVIRKVAAATGIITTIAGNGTGTDSGDGGLATKAGLSDPIGVAVDSIGDVYICEPYRIRKVASKTGIITTIAGTGSAGYTGDGGPAAAATFAQAFGIAVDRTGNLYVADQANNAIRKVSDGIITTVAGNGYGAGRDFGGFSGDGGPATSAELYFPQAVTVDSAGNLYIADTYNQRYRKVTAATGIITTIAGDSGDCYSYQGQGGPATSASFCDPNSVSIDNAGNLYVTDYSSRVQKLTAPRTPPTTVTEAPVFSVESGTYAADQIVTVTEATPGAEVYITLDGTTPTTAGQGYNGPIHVTGNVTIKAIALAPGLLPSTLTTAAYTITAPPTAIIKTVAGNGTVSFALQGGPALSVGFDSIEDIALDVAGDIYIADTGNSVIWKVNGRTGNIAVVAGNGFEGRAGDGGLATSAALNDPRGIAIDGEGNLLIADAGNNVIREVSASTGLITTIAGTGSYSFGGNGDGGPATSATFSFPSAVTVDGSGNIYIADTYDYLVRKITIATGIINSIADPNSELVEPSSLAFDSMGNLYVVSDQGAFVRKIVAGTGAITTIAGNGNPKGYSGDGGFATSAEISANSLAVDSAGNVYISNWPSGVRRIDAASDVITTVAGNGYYGFSGDGGSATIASLSGTTGIALDAGGGLYIADSGNQRVREVTTTAQAAKPTISPAPGTYANAITVTIADATAGAAIYYTINGTTPTAASTRYTVPIKVTATQTIEAVAIATGYADSSIATSTYTIAATTLSLSVSPASLTFASLAEGSTSSAQTITLKNTGTATITLGATSFAGTNPRSFVKSATTCSTSLAAGASCTVSIECKPVVVGALSASLSIADTATGSPQSVALKGTATASAPTYILAVSPASLTFPSTAQGVASKAQTVTVKNAGTGTVTLDATSFTGTNPRSFVKSGSTCASSLAAGASCTISIECDPAVTGTLSAFFNIVSSASGSPQPVTLKGTATAP